MDQTSSLTTKWGAGVGSPGAQVDPGSQGVWFTWNMQKEAGGTGALRSPASPGRPVYEDVWRYLNGLSHDFKGPNGWQTNSQLSCTWGQGQGGHVKQTRCWVLFSLMGLIQWKFNDPRLNQSPTDELVRLWWIRAPRWKFSLIYNYKMMFFHSVNICIGPRNQVGQAFI